MSAEKYVPTKLTDGFVWRASATNHKKENTKVLPGQVALIGRLNITWLHDCASVQLLHQAA